MLEHERVFAFDWELEPSQRVGALNQMGALAARFSGLQFYQRRPIGSQDCHRSPSWPGHSTTPVHGKQPVNRRELLRPDSIEEPIESDLPTWVDCACITGQQSVPDDLHRGLIVADAGMKASSLCVGQATASLP